MEKIRLSDGEWKLMEALWQNPPKTITQLTRELQEKTKWGKIHYYYAESAGS